MSEEEARIGADHYDFARYVDTKRWSSYWHQLKDTLAVRPASVLEIGVGNGLYKAALLALDCPTQSLDVNAALGPDHVGSVTAMPFADDSFSAVVAFQVLEHLPYDDFPAAVAEMRRVAASHVLLSLPDSRKVWNLLLPFFGERRLHIPKPRLRAKRHRVRGQHQWEISKRGYAVERIVADLERAGLDVLRTYRAPENPYHRFFVCRKVPVPAPR